MNKHTPGPWFVDAHNNVLAEGCLVAFPSVASGLEKQEANAHLIAAAPETASERDRLKEINAELLNALEEVFVIGDQLVSAVYGNEFVEKARAVRAKAKGVTP